jgi:L,D-transpeptidase ErfK/SrfK
LKVVNYPYKAGWGGEKLYLETHLPLTGILAKIDEDHATAEQVVKSAISRKGAAYVNWTKALDIAKEQQGMPQEIGHR